jgi:hypothetical protein
MKKIVRLTESDLTRIVKRVMKEEQITESNKIKSILAGLGIALNVGLSSCESKSEVESKLPQIENMIEDNIEEMNNYLDPIEIKNIDSIQGPIRYLPTIRNKELTKWVSDNDSASLYLIISEGVQISDGAKKRVWLVTTYMEDEKESVANTRDFENYSEAMTYLKDTKQLLMGGPEEHYRRGLEPNPKNREY